MSAKYFVDTNIFLYAHDSLTGPKHHRARHLIDGLWTSGEGAISTQVLQELSVNLQRKTAHPVPTEEIEEIIREYSNWRVVTNTPKSILGASIFRHATGYLFGTHLSSRRLWTREYQSSTRKTCPMGNITVRCRLSIRFWGLSPSK